jgi:hypothetical protein
MFALSAFEERTQTVTCRNSDCDRIIIISSSSSSSSSSSLLYIMYKYINKYLYICGWLNDMKFI